MNDDKKRKKETVELATKILTYTNKNGEKVSRTIGFFKNKYNWIIRFDRNPKNDCFYSNFLSFIQDAFSIAEKIGINQMDLSQIKAAHIEALKLTENAHKYASDEIKRLEMLVAEKDAEIAVLQTRLKRIEKTSNKRNISPTKVKKVV